MKIAIMGGSLRKESLNLKLLDYLAKTIQSQGPHVRILAGPDLRLPLYDADLPAPPEAVALHSAIYDCQGLVIVSPEYNAGIPPHLKNAVDWASTLTPSPFRNLPVLLTAASPGALGGARALIQWRAVLANLGAISLPAVIAVPHADRNLGPGGAPLEARAVTEVQKAVTAFLEVTSRLGARP